MKCVLFVGETADYTQDLKAKLLQLGFHSIITENVDEIDQVGQQQNGVVLIFSGKKIPFAFLTDNHWGFPVESILYLERPTNIPEDIAKKIKLIRLRVFDVTKTEKLLKEITDFYSSESGTAESFDINELQFTAQEGLKK